MKYITYKLLIVVFCLQAVSLYAGHESRSHGARSAAMGFADVGLKDFWSLRNNQAGLAYFNQKQVGIYYENRFLISELGFQSIGITIPVKQSIFGVTADYFGDENFNETTIGIAFARQLFENFSVGIQLDYLTTFVNNEYFRRHHLLTFELGLLYDITESITVGAHTYNPFETKLNKDDREIIPATYSLGLVFQINEDILLSSEIEKGIGSNPGIFSFGFETAWKSITFQFASSRHQVLGYSPMASLMINL